MNFCWARKTLQFERFKFLYIWAVFQPHSLKQMLLSHFDIFFQVLLAVSEVRLPKSLLNSIKCCKPQEQVLWKNTLLSHSPVIKLIPGEGRLALITSKTHFDSLSGLICFSWQSSSFKNLLWSLLVQPVLQCSSKATAPAGSPTTGTDPSADIQGVWALAWEPVSDLWVIQGQKIMPNLPGF